MAPPPRSLPEEGMGFPSFLSKLAGCFGSPWGRGTLTRREAAGSTLCPDKRPRCRRGERRQRGRVEGRCVCVSVCVPLCAIGEGRTCCLGADIMSSWK